VAKNINKFQATGEEAKGLVCLSVSLRCVRHPMKVGPAQTGKSRRKDMKEQPAF